MATIFNPLSFNYCCECFKIRSKGVVIDSINLRMLPISKLLVDMVL